MRLQATARSNTTALASASGAKPGTTVVNTLLGNVASFAKGQGWMPGTVTLPTAATPDGQAGVAGAIAVNLASLDASAAGARRHARSRSPAPPSPWRRRTTYTDSALADGTAVNTATGVAGAVAINVSTPTAEATIAGSVMATAVTVTATVSGQTGVTANSGQGSTTVGVAGALALDLPRRQQPRRDRLRRQRRPEWLGNRRRDRAGDDDGHPGQRDGQQQGVGLRPDRRRRLGRIDIAGNGATAEASGTVTSPDQVTVFASGSYTESDTADAGATGGTAAAPALALAVTNNVTMALVGTAAVISAGGQMLVRALHRDKSTSTASGSAAGSAVAVGAAIGIDVGLDNDEATIDGKVTKSASLPSRATWETPAPRQGTSSAKGAASGGSGINSVIGGRGEFREVVGLAAVDGRRSRRATTAERRRWPWRRRRR